ncbi:VTT domain-containing protein [Streptomyces sp. NPDC101181]|uniref:DedA family protein n=1 Tax=Streptomyces sp. NPDC101181 TaxID=3366125 RepID=UPI0038245E52
MLESVAALTSSPWIYAVVALSVLLDVFLPLLPSGVLVITAATAAAASSTSVTGAIVLILCATSASVLGDLVAYRLAWRGGDRLDRAIARSRRLTTAQERLGVALSRGGGALVVIARFAPAGRSVVSLGAGAAHRRVRDFLPWSALAGLAWACYSVGLGYFGGRWLGSTWFGTAVSVLALFMAGALAAYVVKRPAAVRAAAEAAEATDPPASPRPPRRAETTTGQPSTPTPTPPHTSAPRLVPETTATTLPGVPAQPSVPASKAAPATGTTSAPGPKPGSDPADSTTPAQAPVSAPAPVTP